MTEDIDKDTPLTARVRSALGHWATQHNYDGPSWDGVEAFHRALANAVTHVSIESAGWYRYPSSLRPDMDGKDWRLCIPDNGMVVSVNCHSLLHDNLWTLSTTIFSTQEIDVGDLVMVGHPDPDYRAVLWTLRVAEALETHGYNYEKVKAELRARL